MLHPLEPVARPARQVMLHALVAAAYTVLAVLHTYPLVHQMPSHLSGLTLGDNVSFVWNIWWMREALASPQADYFNGAPLFAPFGAPLVLHTHTALSAFAGATALASRSAAEAQNVLLIASLALNGFAAYLLALQITRSRRASIAAGALFLVAPAVTSRLMGHYNLVLVWPLILACCVYVSWVRTSTWARSIGVGVAAAIIPYCDYYYTIFFFVFSLVYLGMELWTVALQVSPRRKRTARLLFALALVALAVAVTAWATAPSAVTLGSLRVSIRSPTNALTAAWVLAGAGLLAGWRPAIEWTRRADYRSPRTAHAVVALLTFVLLTLPLSIPAWRLWQSGGYVTQSSSLQSSPRGVDLGTTVMGPAFSGFAGGTIREAYARLGIDPMESSAWSGAAMTALIVVALRQMWSVPEVRRWAGIGVVFALWALGPYLYVFGTNTGLLLPQAIVRFAPVLNNARIPGRAMVVVALCSVLLVAMLLAHAGKRWRFALWALVVIGVAESLAAPLPLIALPNVHLYRRLQPDVRRDAGVLHVPFGVRDGFGEQGAFDHEALYAQTVHRHAIAGGFLARVRPDIRSWYDRTEPYRSLLRLSRSDGNTPLPSSCREALAGLKRANMSYVVLNRQAASAALVAFVEDALPLRAIESDERRTLFVVAPERCNGR